MFAISRLLLIATAVLIGWCVVLVGMKFGLMFGLIAGVALLGVGPKRIGQVFTSFGTAKWAAEKELRRAGMIGTKQGLILGRLHDLRKPRLLPATIRLLNPLAKSLDACEYFIGAVFRRLR
jgi:hypothetical protein